MSNTRGGNYRTSPANSMRAFDKLPGEIRAALANAVEDWVPQPLLTQYRRCGLETQVVLKLIGRWDRQELANREQQRARASGPYKGNVPDSSIRAARGRS